MQLITLEWKSFPVKVEKVNFSLKSILSINFDGLICDQNFLNVIFKDVISQEDQDLVTNYWNNITEASFQLSMEEIIQSKIDGAIAFGQKIILDALIENVAMGITQAGKTREVSDYLGQLQRYLREGSLYAAIEEIDDLIANTIPSELAPFVTEARLLNAKSKIVTYVTI